MAALCARLAGNLIIRHVRCRLVLNRVVTPNVETVTCYWAINHSKILNGPSQFENETLQNSAGIYQPVRYYSKGKSKGEKKKKGPVAINEQEISEVIDLEALRSDLQHAVDHLRAEYVKNLTIRSSAGAIENIMVSFEGESYPLQEVATVGRKGPQVIVVNMAALPQVIPSVLKAINDSGMGLNPQQDGTTLYIPIPKVTKEYREQLAKNAKVLFNKFKESIRDIQNRHIRELKKQEKTVSSDLIFSVQNQIHTLAESFIQDAEKLMIAKQNELLGVKD